MDSPDPNLHNRLRHSKVIHSLSAIGGGERDGLRLGLSSYVTETGVMIAYGHRIIQRFAVDEMLERVAAGIFTIVYTKAMEE